MNLLAATESARRFLLICAVAVKAHPVDGQFGFIGIGVQDLPADIVVDLFDHDLEGRLDVRRVESRSLHKEQAFGFCEGFAFFYRHFSDVREVAFVAHQHLRDSRVRMCCIDHHHSTLELSSRMSDLKLIKTKISNFRHSQSLEGGVSHRSAPLFYLVPKSLKKHKLFCNEIVPNIAT